MLKPFGQSELTYHKRVFNYRLSRGRNVVENVFGIIAARFRVLHTAISVHPENAKYIIMAIICVLHNFLRHKSKSYFNRKTVDSENKTTHEIRQDGECRSDTVELSGLEKKQTTDLKEGKQTREEYLHFLNGNGSVAWQEDMLEKGKA
ncbi:hypothetical protein NQ314_013178 [Rhamnusium bicolor]|uniref:DDE Tnp4 domain-containing protein n=1 Tax=Rhamnusium bicolor TaxID=1586634 RepID=A0AAV8XA16_9CUCU|nr:hypothetical protein NQ314_013178 [Rhamnusium bicolor]